MLRHTLAAMAVLAASSATASGKWVGASGGGNFTEGPGSGKDNKHYFVCFDGEVRTR